MLRPETIPEVSAIVSKANSQGRRIWPRGGGTRAVPGRGTDLIVDLTALHRVVEHTPEDLVASVECGISYAEFQKRLGLRSQRLPLDPACAPRSTVGGVLATNAFGPLRLRYGTARDWVIGTTVVASDGRIVHAGGMVVKNVSGYDLSKIYIGSWGSLGIVVQANFKLAPAAKAKAVIAADVQERRDAWRIVSELLEEPLPLVSAVFLLPASDPGAADASSAGRLFLGFEGVPGTLERQVERVLARRESFSTVDSAPELSRDYAALVRLSYLPASYCRALEEAPRADYEYTLLGSGISWLGWRRPPAVETLTRVRGAMFEKFPGDVPRWELSGTEEDLTKRLKSALDPRGTFPGAA